MDGVRPSDNYVARKFVVTKGRVRAAPEVIVEASLEAIREQLEQGGLVCLKRSPEDDPKIMEVWL